MSREKFMPDASHKDRLDVLQNTAEYIDDNQRMVRLTDDELEVRREEYANNAIDIDRETETLDEAKLKFKTIVSPLKTQNAKLIKSIRTKQESREGTFYTMADHENNVMVTYDKEGNYVDERRMRPDEKRQSKLFIATGKDKNGTQD